MRYRPKTSLKKKSGREKSSMNDLNQYFDIFFGSHQPSFIHSDVNWHPSADMFETEDKIVIVVELAGMQIENVNILLEKDSVIVRGVRQEPHTEEKRQYHSMEIPYGPFERTFTLSSPVNPDKIDASYKSGFLKINLQKQEDAQKKKRTIKIR